MKTAPQITAPLIIHQNIVLNKHNRPLLAQKGQKPTWDSNSFMKNRSSVSVYSAAPAIWRKEIALHLEADSRCAHASQNMHMYIYTRRYGKYIYIGTNMCLYTEQIGKKQLSGCQFINSAKSSFGSFLSARKIPPRISENNRQKVCSLINQSQCGILGPEGSSHKNP